MKKVWKVVLVISMLIAIVTVRLACRLRLHERQLPDKAGTKRKLLRLGDWASDVSYHIFMRPFRKPKRTLPQRAWRWLKKKRRQH